MGFGQSKLPGNRQRVISSGAQQFVDRSFVNANFTLDRDFGVFAYYSDKLVFLDFNLKGAVSSGEGRTGIYSDKGLDYTGRVELLPFGQFTGNGDFFEGDLERETTPKLSLAGGYSYNNKATKSMGQRGSDLYQRRNLESSFYDVMLKYSGWAFSSEYISRATSNPFTISPESDTVFVYTGYGVNTQLSYLFSNYYEVALRYAFIKPEVKLKSLTPQQNIVTLGVNKYVKKHLLKIQTNLSYNYNDHFDLNNTFSSRKDKWLLHFQVEFGI